MKHTRKIPLFLTAAMAWFGYHCGAGFASGRQVWLYANRYGTKGILACLIAWIVCGSFIFVTSEYARVTHAKNYRDLSNGIYVENSTISRIALFCWDIMVALAAIVGCGSCVAGSGTLFHNLSGMPYMLGCLIFVTGMILITGCGKNVLERLGNVGIALITVFFLVCITGILRNTGHLAAVLTTSLGSPVEENASLWTIIRSGFTYGIVQISFLQAACVMAGKFESRKETTKFVLTGMLLNCGAMIVSFLCIMTYYPQIGESTLPMISIIQDIPGTLGSLMLIAYNLVLVLAYITTAGALVVGNVARYTPLLEKKLKSPFLCRMIIIVIVLGGGSLVSRLGLDGVLTKANAFNASLRIPLWFVPIMILGPISIHRELKKNNIHKEDSL